MISRDSPSLATHYLRMMSPANTQMATATGFLYEYDDEIFLITNGHNITRINPGTNRRIIDSAAFPVYIRTKGLHVLPNKENILAVTEFFIVELYEDSEFRKPKWLVHPENGHSIDVVAIPVEKRAKIPEHIKLFPINKYNFDTEFEERVGDDVFILGYPFDLTGSLELPIWKRGTIATEPLLDMEGLPKMLVDTATRQGMSGAPVLMRRTGVHWVGNTSLSGKEFIGLIQNFIGVYSGRLGAEDEFKAQLGIVWKKKVIDEILHAKQIATIEFQSL